MQITWHAREFPLAPCALAARNGVAQKLARRLLARDDEYLSALSGVAGDKILIILGQDKNLPWADGALYLGRDEDAPSLLLPTTLNANVPLPLVERALHSRFAQLPLPLAVLPQWNLVLSCGASQIVVRRQLENFASTLEIR